jgi:hypothetical protein
MTGIGKRNDCGHARIKRPNAMELGGFLPSTYTRNRIRRRNNYQILWMAARHLAER